MLVAVLYVGNKYIPDRKAASSRLITLVIKTVNCSCDQPPQREYPDIPVSERHVHCRYHTAL